MAESKYFVSYALKYKDAMMQPITLYGSIVTELPHEIVDETDIADLHSLINRNNTEYDVFVLSIQKLPV